MGLILPIYFFISQSAAFSQSVFQNCIADTEIRTGIGGDCTYWENENYHQLIFARAMRWTHHSPPSYCSDWAKMRALFKYDLNVLPLAHRLYDNRAYLHLYFPGGDQTQYGNNIFFVERITQAWTETTVTWATQPSTSTANTVTVPAATSTTQHYVIDISDIAYEWICNNANNHGVKLWLDNENATIYRRVTFATKENANAALHPKLRLEYAYIESHYAFCTGGSFLTLEASLFNAHDPSVYNFVWTHVNSGDTYNGATWNNPPLLSGVPNTYIVTVTNPWCQSATDTIILSHPGGNLPTSDFTVSSPVCIGDTALITYTGNAAPHNTYMWHFAGGQVISGTGQGPFLVFWPNEGTYNVSLTVIADSCPSPPTTIAVVVSDSINTSILSNSPLCEGDDILLSATGGTSYHWAGANNFSSSIPNPVIANATTSHNGWYYLTASSGSCSGSDSVYIQVNPVPIANAGSDVSIYQGENITLYGSGGQTYMWQPSQYLSNPNLASPIANPPVTTTFTLTVWNIYGCSASDQVTITVITEENMLSNIFVPNIFSPNADGINDQLYVYGPGIKEMRFFIFNRWGEKVFETTQQQTGWDGTYKDNLIQEGVYTYFLEIEMINGEKQKRKGNISLIK